MSIDTFSFYVLRNPKYIQTPGCPESTNRSCVQLSQLPKPIPFTKPFTSNYEGIQSMYHQKMNGNKELIISKIHYISMLMILISSSNHIMVKM